MSFTNSKSLAPGLTDGERSGIEGLMEKPPVFNEWIGEALAFAELTQNDVDMVVEDVRQLKAEAYEEEREELGRAWKRLEMGLTRIKPLLRP